MHVEIVVELFGMRDDGWVDISKWIGKKSS